MVQPTAQTALISCAPVFHEMIWGGRNLADSFGYDIPDGAIGECWAISAHPHGDCRVIGGAFDGMLLSELWRDYREQLFTGCNAPEFPLLVKIIDAEQDLSIQVHPDDAYAAQHEHGSLGKRECWYILDCADDATIIVGQHACSREAFERQAKAGNWKSLLNEIPIHPGDFFQIDPGTVHAIKAGTLILETQQSSDITYRVYDYDRLGADGKPRKLHVAQSLEVIAYHRPAPTAGLSFAKAAAGVAELESNENYTVQLLRVSSKLEIEQTHPFMCLSVIAGRGQINERTVQKGDHLIAPAHVGTLNFAGEIDIIASFV
ncbi:class I mannose-6-phosphate isomerase [Collinsella sp. zg1085]|uniref:type I phosphomannose isomerase catalytic subunit n=1 Tax=Collinsella sp. zg1085 TaxID=2844380 RepID=UPI001C0C72E9|nr:type I phosphomannose isomerase catalytic subunit [Collinsella sp. zg1085]QWT17389.1 class I mannose-6-phosphate isomerase [Collinsella sp. zg1085]